MPLRCGSFQDCWVTNYPYLPMSKNFWWARRDLNSHPEGLVSKTSAAANYATGPLDHSRGVEPRIFALQANP